MQHAARGKAAQAMWQAYVQQRRAASMGLSLPSSKSLWDVVNRRLLEPHGAEAVRDIWMEVRACERLLGGVMEVLKGFTARCAA